MSDYKAPLRDLRFVCDELLDSDTHYQKFPQFSEVNSELRDAILEEAGKFAEQVLAPTNRNGDEQGCQFEGGVVTTPDGFKEAYQAFVDGGWAGLSMPEAFGGQDLPHSLDLVVSELFGQANHAWAMCPGLSAGCRSTLLSHGTPELQKTYLHKLTEGSWTGTMCLTEPQGGSDLSFLKTKAVDNGDGSYAVTGTKIFISAGEHDMSDNIVHLVLARLPDAPAGTKGISLILVPKFLPDANGEPGERNTVQAGSIEHKMGIHGSPTCVMNFDEAKGYLIGEPHQGLRCMFTFMNAARIGTALEGASHAEVALQGAMSYALDREAGRSLAGVKSPDRPADKLIVHPDVRKMVQTIRAFAEGNRAFAHYLGQLVDGEHYGDGEQKAHASGLLALLTPIAKGFMTETGIEAASHGVQVYGGHGYVREWGMEQNLRDSRIATLYEGTTGIQALDLLGRKVLPDGGEQFGRFLKMIAASLPEMDPQFAAPLGAKLQEWEKLTRAIGVKSMSDVNEMAAASTDFLMYSGYVVVAWFWGRMGTLAKAKAAESSDVFYRAKLNTAQFYFQRILPRTTGLKEAIEAGGGSLMALSDEDFAELYG